MKTIVYNTDAHGTELTSGGFKFERPMIIMGSDGERLTALYRRSGGRSVFASLTDFPVLYFCPTCDIDGKDVITGRDENVYENTGRDEPALCEACNAVAYDRAHS